MLGNPEMGESSVGRRETEVLGDVGAGAGATAAGSVVAPPAGAAVFIEREGEKNGAESGGVGGHRNSPGNRWPQEETLALLRIRFEMDASFREAGIKSHFWDEISRRLADLGYNRSGKKCKEKFENVYKYHKRTKRYQTARSNGKSYRFFDQLEALDHHGVSSPSSGYEQGDPAMPTASALPNPHTNPETIPTQAPLQTFDASFWTGSTSATSSSGNESECGRRKKKRKWEEFFNKLMKSVLEKQADLQNKFLEALERSERERVAREEAWKKQELDRIRKEKDLLMQERSIAAAKDAAVLAFLEKITEKGKGSVQVERSPVVEKTKSLVQLSQIPVSAETPVTYKQNDTTENVSGHENSAQTGSRWPKDEVDALIKLRTNMEFEQQESGPKGSLWEEVSAAMKKLGYDRNAKRCKEKWENINKYFRRVKESNKKRPLDSKTCPYFHQLEALYQMKMRKTEHNADNSSSNLRPEELLLHMMNHQPEHQQPEEQMQQGPGDTGVGVDQSENDQHDNEVDGFEQETYQIVGSNGTSSMPMME